MRGFDERGHIGAIVNGSMISLLKPNNGDVGLGACSFDSLRA